MSTFDDIIERIIVEHEGGYKLTDIKGDRGGQTYAGIARKPNPDWDGWRDVDAKRTPSKESVHRFYRARFWDPCKCDEIQSPKVATSIFDFAINSGTETAKRLAQKAAMVESDGSFGPVTLRALNLINAELFMYRFAIQKIARYSGIVERFPDQVKFLRGWINRSVEGLV